MQNKVLQLNLLVWERIPFSFASTQYLLVLLIQNVVTEVRNSLMFIATVTAIYELWCGIACHIISRDTIYDSMLCHIYFNWRVPIKHHKLENRWCTSRGTWNWCVTKLWWNFASPTQHQMIMPIHVRSCSKTTSDAIQWLGLGGTFIIYDRWTQSEGNWKPAHILKSSVPHLR